MAPGKQGPADIYICIYKYSHKFKRPPYLNVNIWCIWLTVGTGYLEHPSHLECNIWYRNEAMFELWCICENYSCKWNQKKQVCVHPQVSSKRDDEILLGKWLALMARAPLSPQLKQYAIYSSLLQINGSSLIPRTWKHTHFLYKLTDYRADIQWLFFSTSCCQKFGCLYVWCYDNHNMAAWCVLIYVTWRHDNA